MSGFVKLDCGIINSSLWFEPPSTRVVFITLLAKCNPDGFARCVRQAWERDSNVGHEEFDRAVLCLESPDANSRDRENDGRRVEQVEGGWKVLNYKKWRAFLYSESYEAKKKRKQRDSHVPTCPDLSPDHKGHSPSPSPSLSSSVQEGESEGKESHFPEIALPGWPEFWQYCQQIGLTAEFYAKDKFLAASQDNWRNKSNWQAYANRCRSWWEEAGRPMTKGTKPGKDASPQVRLRVIEELITTHVANRQSPNFVGTPSKEQIDEIKFLRNEKRTIERSIAGLK